MPNPEAMTDPAGAVERARTLLSTWAEIELKMNGGRASKHGQAIVALVEDHTRLLSRVTELEKALGPFADLAAALNKATDDSRSLADAIDMIPGRYRHVTAGDLRTAARTLANKDG